MSIDKWKQLRKNLYGNVEPSVELVGLTVPGQLQGVDFYVDGSRFFLTPIDIESQVALAASVSTGVDPKDVLNLNQKLIQLGHHTPLESIQYNFRVDGISKACSAQMSRHRISGHVGSSRRYQVQESAFVYPLLEKVKDEAVAKTTYQILSDIFSNSMIEYQRLRGYGLKKGDIRYLIPVASATSRVWWINARSLRNFLNLRLAETAEQEIRRLALLILNIVMRITPSLFIDIAEQYKCIYLL